jgi:hypothetical protein
VGLDKKITSNGRESSMDAASKTAEGEDSEMMFPLDENGGNVPPPLPSSAPPDLKVPIVKGLSSSPPASSVGSGSLPSVMIANSSPVSHITHQCHAEGGGREGVMGRGYSVRHPHSKQTKLMAQKLSGGLKPVKTED